MKDIVVIGAGVTGAILTRELAKYDLSILVLEKESDVGNVTSSANSAIIHSGYDPLPGTLKAKLAKLRRELLTPSGGGGGGGIGFDVAKTGVARVGFVGFPSVGKSTLMSKMTGTHSEVGAYEFTTLTTGKL